MSEPLAESSKSGGASIEKVVSLCAQRGFVFSVE